MTESSCPQSPSPASAAFEADTCGVTFAFDFDKYPIDEKKIPVSFVPDGEQDVGGAVGGVGNSQV